MEYYTAPNFFFLLLHPRDRGLVQTLETLLPSRPHGPAARHVLMPWGLLPLAAACLLKHWDSVTKGKGHVEADGDQLCLPRSQSRRVPSISSSLRDVSLR